MQNWNSSQYLLIKLKKVYFNSHSHIRLSYFWKDKCNKYD